MPSTLELLRGRIIKNEHAKLLHIFDTARQQSGKDVTLIERRGQKMILRIGETRTKNFFPDGYHGETFIIPKIFKTSRDPLFELEEYCDGTLLADLDPQPTASHIIRHDLQTKLLTTFWETQHACRTQSLEPLSSHAPEHLRGAQPLLTRNACTRLQNILQGNQRFLQPRFPSKWKYADDNILLRVDGRLGLIDLPKVGLRHFGYDIGWIFWPRWFRMHAKEWKRVRMYHRALETFFEEWWKLAPSPHPMTRRQFSHTADLLLLTRIVGAFFDVAQNLPHVQQWLATNQRRAAFLSFLHALLRPTLQKFQNNE